MTVTKGKVVQMSYVLKNTKGDELDRSDEGSSFEYLHGAQQIVPGLENALEGLKKGDKKKVSVSPAEGYGEINPQLRVIVPRSEFAKEMKLAVGMEFQAQLEDGPAILRIHSIDGDKVTVDGNHPLAGETLHFDIEIVGVRDATKEEISHGHAHGPHGHDH